MANVDVGDDTAEVYTDSEAEADTLLTLLPLPLPSSSSSSTAAPTFGSAINARSTTVLAVQATPHTHFTGFGTAKQLMAAGGCSVPVGGKRKAESMGSLPSQAYDRSRGRGRGRGRGRA